VAGEVERPVAPCARWPWASTAAATASPADPKMKMQPSHPVGYPLPRRASAARVRIARCRSMTSTKVSPSAPSSGVDPSTSVKSSVAIRGGCIGVRAGAAGGRPHLRCRHQASRSRARWVKLRFRYDQSRCPPDGAGRCSHHLRRRSCSAARARPKTQGGAVSLRKGRGVGSALEILRRTRSLGRTPPP
jgi:hypothetical protein